MHKPTNFTHSNAPFAQMAFDAMDIVSWVSFAARVGPPVFRDALEVLRAQLAKRCECL